MEQISAFVDESRRASYIVCAVLAKPHQVQTARNHIRRFRLPGQRRIHFVKERRSRKTQFLTDLSSMDLRCRLYLSNARDMVARRQCLHQLTIDLAKLSVLRLVVEPIEGLEAYDTDAIYQARMTVPWHNLAFEHLESFEELMLCAADAVAWAYGSGGDWRRRVVPMIDAVVKVDP